MKCFLKYKQVKRHNSRENCIMTPKEENLETYLKRNILFMKQKVKKTSERHKLGLNK